MRGIIYGEARDGKENCRNGPLQNRNTDTDVEGKKCMDTNGGRRRWDELGNWDQHTYNTDTIHEIEK